MARDRSVNHPCRPLTRRDVLRMLGTSAVLALPSGGAGSRAAPSRGPILSKAIPSSGERIPLVGLGTWVTFNVGDDPAARDSSAEVLRAFFGDGGRLVDSSPMYGSSQEVIGYGLRKTGGLPLVFSADKVWTSGRNDAPGQIEQSRRNWGVPRFDLLEVHNLLSWREHLPLLFEMKAAGRLRYVGVTTSEGRRHDELARILQTERIDFVQATYNAVDREVEARILPLARDRGIAVIVNRPFRRGELIEKVARAPLPAWAAEIDCRTWAQVLLKFIVSHPAVTCAIPATTRIDHVRENIGASYGRLPDEALRQRIAGHIQALG